MPVRRPKGLTPTPDPSSPYADLDEWLSVPLSERNRMAEELQFGKLPGDDERVNELMSAPGTEVERIRTERSKFLSDNPDFTGQNKEFGFTEKYLKPIGKGVLDAVPGVGSNLFPRPLDATPIPDLGELLLGHPKPSVSEPPKPQTPQLPRGKSADLPSPEIAPLEVPPVTVTGERPAKPGRFQVEEGEIIDTINRQIISREAFDKLARPEEKADIDTLLQAGEMAGDDYDYDAAKAAGIQGPDANGHWPSKFKADHHPNRFIPSELGIYDSKHDRIVSQQEFEQVATPDQQATFLEHEVLPKAEVQGYLDSAAKEQARLSGQSRVPTLAPPSMPPDLTAFPGMAGFDEKIRAAEAQQQQTGLPPDPLARYDSFQPLSLGQAFEEAGKSFARGTGQTSGLVLKGVGLFAKELDTVFGIDKKPDDYATYKLGDKIGKWATTTFKGRPDLQSNFLLTTLFEGAGSSIPFLAMGAAGSAVGAGAGATAATTGALAGGAGLVERAPQGTTDAQRRMGLLLGAALGSTEGIPIADLFQRMNTATGGNLAHAAKVGTIQAIEEAVQEGVQQLGENAVVKYLYGVANQSLTEGAIEGMGAGGIVGFLTGFMLSGKVRMPVVRQKGDEDDEKNQGAMPPDLGPLPAAAPKEGQSKIRRKIEEEVQRLADQFPPTLDVQKGKQPKLYKSARSNAPISTVDPTQPIVPQEEIGARQSPPVQAPAPMLDPPSPVVPKAETPKIIDLSGMGPAISNNMYSSMFEKVQNGETKEAGQESVYLQAAKPVQEAGGFTGLDDFKVFVQAVNGITSSDLKGKERDAAIREVIQAWMPEQKESTPPGLVQAPGLPAPPQLATPSLAEDVQAEQAQKIQAEVKKQTPPALEAPAEQPVQAQGTKEPWAMSLDEFLQSTRFYRSGKSKNAQVPGGERVILKQDSTPGNFREVSKGFLSTVRNNVIAKAIKEGKPVPPEIKSEYFKDFARTQEVGTENGNIRRQSPGLTLEESRKKAEQIVDEKIASGQLVFNPSARVPKQFNPGEYVTQPAYEEKKQEAPPSLEPPKQEPKVTIREAAITPTRGGLKVTPLETTEYPKPNTPQKALKKAVDDAISAGSPVIEEQRPPSLEPPSAKKATGDLPIDLARVKEVSQKLGKSGGQDGRGHATSIADALRIMQEGDAQAGIEKLRRIENEIYRQFPELSQALGEAIDGPAKTVATPSLTEPITESPTRETAPSLEPVTKERAAQAVSGWVADRLRAGDSITTDLLFEQYDTMIGGTQAEGKYTPKDAFDALELGVNRYILDRDVELSPSARGTEQARTVVERIRQDILDKLPSQQNRRTAEQDEFQQFSTPPDLAFAMNWAAHVKGGDVFLEPSAGLGGLAVFGKNAGATVYVNEYSQRRADLLKTLPFEQVFTENAEQLNNILPESVRPTVIVMNPPFSSTAGRIEGQRKTSNVFSHLEQALARLEPGGRLVALIGKGKIYKDPLVLERWLSDTAKTHTYRARIGISGQGYKKYGTTYDNQIIVFDKMEPTGQPIVRADVENVLDALPLLKEVRDARPTIQDKRPSARTGSQAIPDLGEGGRRPDAIVSPPTPPMGLDESQPQTSRPGLAKPDSGARRPSDGGRPAGRAELSSQESQRSGESIPSPAAAPSSDESQGGGNRGVQRPGPGARGGSDRGGLPPEQISSELESEEVEPRKAGDLGESIYQDYVPSKFKIKGAQPHRGQLQESAALSAVDPADISYVPRLPKAMIERGDVSLAQIEAIAYAGQAHEQTLPGGARRGFFLGDGPGVGKGRTIAAIIMDNMNQGRKKAAWISETGNLYDSAVRDWTALGGKSSDLAVINKVKLGKPIPLKQGVLFMTYSTLGSGIEVTRSGAMRAKQVKGGTPEQRVKTRLDQLTDWLGADFDGVIVFDEAHNMQNALAEEGTMGTTQPAARALAGVELQKRFPNARFVYSSATGATKLSALAYAERLGLWGKGSAFPKKQDFLTEIGNAGLGALEIVAQNIKAQGSYISRNLSYDGVDYDKIEHELTPEQQDIYNELGRAWQLVLGNIRQALELSGVTEEKNGQTKTKNGRAKAAIMGRFWGTQLRFYNQVLNAMQMPSVIKDMEKRLEAGDAIVVQLTNTDEAALQRELQKVDAGDLDLGAIDLTPRQDLMTFVKNAFPVTQFEDYRDEDGNVRSRPVLDSQGSPVVNREAVKMREDLLDKLGSLRVPDSPIDMILKTFGPDNVAEITGRKERVVRYVNSSGEQVEERQKNRSEALRKAEAAEFMADKRRILIFSEKGGTGESYHADLSKKNQRVRSHYLVQAGWRADKAVQGLGRTHRTNQKQPPRYVLTMTNINGHKRFLSTIARRLDQLGALTKGQRQAGSSGLLDAKDNLENEYATAAIRQLYKDVINRVVPDVSLDMITSKVGLDKVIDARSGAFNEGGVPDVPQFLNRLLTLELHEQNLVFDEFKRRMDQFIEVAAAKELLDVGMQTFRAAGGVKELRNEAVYTDPTTGATTKLIDFEATHLTQFVPVETFTIFARNNKSGKVFGVRDLGNRTDKDGAVTHVFRLSSHIAGKYRYIPEEQYKELYSVVNAADARKAWEQQTQEEKPTHTEQLSLVTGSLLNVWKRLPGLFKHIVRLKTTDGAVHIGVQLTPDAADQFRVNLGVQAARSLPKLSPGGYADEVMDKGSTLELANGWTVKRTRVAGEARMELSGDNLYGSREALEKAGVFSERINFATRYFLPTGQSAGTTLSNVLKLHPVVKMLRASDRGQQAAGGQPSFERRTAPRPDRITDAPTYPDFAKALAMARPIGGENALRLSDSSRQYPIGLIQDLAKQAHVHRLVKATEDAYQTIRTALAKTDAAFTDVVFSGFSPDDYYAGVNLRGASLFKGQSKDVILVNPWAMAWRVNDAIQDEQIGDTDADTYFASHMIDTLMHELTHQQVRTTHEDDRAQRFEQQLDQNYDRIGLDTLMRVTDQFRAALKEKDHGYTRFVSDLDKLTPFWRTSTRLPLEASRLHAADRGTGDRANVAGEGTAGRTGPPDLVPGRGEDQTPAMGTRPAFQRRESGGERSAPPQYLAEAQRYREQRAAEDVGFSSSDPDIEARVRAAKQGLQPDSLKSRLTEHAAHVWRLISREYENLPDTGQFSQLRTDLLRLQKYKGIAADKIERDLASIVKPLNRKQYDQLEWKALLSDLKREADQDRALPFGYTPEKVQDDLDRLNATMESDPLVNDAWNKRQALWDRLKTDYQKAMDAIGFDTSKKLTKEDYFRHQVLEYSRERTLKGTGSRVRTPTGRGFLKARQGSGLDINANYVQAEFEVMAQMVYDTQLAKVIKHVDRDLNIRRQLTQEAKKQNKQAIDSMIFAGGERGALIEAAMKDFSKRIGMHMSMIRGALNLDKSDTLTLEQIQGMANDPESPANLSARGVFKAIGERKAFIKEVLGNRFVNAEDLIPETHELWPPREGSIFYMADSIPAQMAKALQEGMLEEVGLKAEHLQKILAMGGKREHYIIPKEAKATLDDLSHKEHSFFVEMNRSFLRYWKQLMLVSPRRVIRYNLRNLTGDVDATFVGNPSAFAKYKQSAVELIPVIFKDKPLTGEAKEWAERGGYGSTLQMQELGDINDLKAFAVTLDREAKGGWLKMPAATWNAYWKAARLSTDYREAIGRYAAYLSFLEQMQKNPNGRPDSFGASKPETVMALQDVRDRAFKLSNELLGAYDRVSVAGQTLRSFWYPFWSWQEVNATRYYQMAKNAFDGQDAGTLARGAVIGTKKGAAFLIKMTAAWAMLQAWNYLMFGDDEDELRETNPTVANRPHILFGRDDNGKIQYLAGVGALGDLLAWFGLDEFPGLVGDVMHDRLTLGEAFTRTVKAAPNKIWQGITPTVKLPVELAFRQSTYPSVFQPRPIQDRLDYLGNQTTFGPEIRALRDKPDKPIYGGEDLTGLVVQRTDPKSAAYGTWMGIERKYLERMGKESSAVYWRSPRGEALSNWARALKEQDEDALATWKAEYERLEREKLGKSFSQAKMYADMERSLRAKAPLAGVSKAERDAIVEQLDSQERRTLRKAEAYYRDTMLQVLPASRRSTFERKLQGQGRLQKPQLVPSLEP